MKRIQSFLLALVFVTVLSVSAPAGHIESGAVPDPTPEPTPESMTASPEEFDINTVSWFVDAFGIIWLIYR